MEIPGFWYVGFSFINSDGSTEEGTFAGFVDESVFNTDNDVYKNDSWHYAYSMRHCINNNVENGRVLVIGDSYDRVTVPFLSLGVHEIDSSILRQTNRSFSLRDYILENGYDTVIIAYAQFMVGSHDDTANSNYRMFSFNR